MLAGLLDHMAAGVDEVGRGPLAGPVVAAAVILDSKKHIAGLADSKRLTASQRENLYTEIKVHCLAYAIGRAEVAEIDQLNIHHATLLAMKRAIDSLSCRPSQLLIDGKYGPKIEGIPMQTIIKGDQTVPAISAASIMAKVTRDRELAAYESRYPGYGFAQHKGYPTRQHLNALSCLGVTPLHRRSYGPVKALLELVLT